MLIENAPRVWVGCLACYNEGLLLGEWFAADEAPQSEQEFNDAVKTPASHRDGAYPHEEIWVFDHEGIPVSGEFSPNMGHQYAAWLEGLDDSDYEAFTAYLAVKDGAFDEDSVDGFRDAYRGKWDSDADFARDWFHETHDQAETPTGWPFHCIDWQWASRDLMADFNSENGHYFYAH